MYRYLKQRYLEISVGKYKLITAYLNKLFICADFDTFYFR
jgi:hypothetical protein